MEKDLNVVYQASVAGQIGYPIGASEFGKALSKYVNLAVIPQYGVQNPNTLDPAIIPLIKKLKYMPLDSIHVMKSIATKYDMHFRFGGKKRIGYTLLEGTELPDDWIEVLNSLDQVWTNSTFCKRNFQKSGVKNTKLVNEGVDSNKFHPNHEPLPQFAKDDSFKFLCIGKLEVRKNHAGLLRAFAEEFDKDEKVSLFLQPFNPFDPNYDIERFIKELNLPKNRAPINILDAGISSRALQRLYCTCDAFVMPTRSETWCLPFIEAMSSGLPVIGTNYSGHLDYMNKNNSYLINVKEKIPIEDPHWGHWVKGTWAEPDLEHMKQLMRHVFENPEEAKNIGMKAHNYVKKNFQWDRGAKQAARLLKNV